ncbi:hypothetical protein YA0783_24880 [Pseudomonas corrugata]|uniref:hypothetical protein n=1 Tax=Pseudomonas corrugata TaxID=47879 RepID=UPI0018E5C725|nr:hypothetical protein [Pseudomonas corrugata]MBI6621527.1 hypothetical protein [Pseudomonas corrugata]MBI6694238.1 hypothetical protein [Pseudomonas corrugata]
MTTTQENIVVDYEITENLREYLFASVRLQAYTFGSHAWEKARLDMLLRADTLASTIAQRVGSLKCIQS